MNDSVRIIINGKEVKAKGVSSVVLVEKAQLSSSWCLCEPETGASYFEDGGCFAESCSIWKHHYHCSACGKLVQIG